MSDYSQIEDFSAKDGLASGNPEKVILGSDIDGELSAISTAIASKYDSSDLASQAQAEAGSSNAVLMTPARVQNWADYNAGMVGDIQALTDPGADTLLGWDDSASAAIGFTIGDGLETTAGGVVQLDSSIFSVVTGSEVQIDTTALDFNATLDLSGAATFNSTVTLSAVNPWFRLYESGAAADEKYTSFESTGGAMLGRVYNDALSAGTTWLSVLRTGTTVDEIQLDATSFDLNGALTVSGDIDAADAGNLFTTNRPFTSKGSTGCYLGQYVSGANTNEKMWVIGVNSSGDYEILARTDADAAGATAVSIQRTTTTIDEIELNATTLDFNGKIDNDQGVALGAGASATLGTIGGSGPTTAAQAQWLEISINGTTHWIPVWT